MKKTLRYASTALLYSLIEVELKRFITNLDGQIIKPIRGSFLDAFSKHLEQHSLPVKTFRQYPSIDELRKVRNAIIHFWGEMKHVCPAKLKRDLIDMSDFQEKGILCDQCTEILIEKRFLCLKLQDSWDFFLELFRWANWRIDDLWLTRRKTE